MAGVKPAPPPVHVDEAETIRQLVEGDSDRICDLGGDDGCDRLAAWGIECQQCGCFVASCTGHREFWDRLQQNGVPVRCNPHDHRYPRPLPWVPL